MERGRGRAEEGRASEEEGRGKKEEGSGRRDEGVRGLVGESWGAYGPFKWSCGGPACSWEGFWGALGQGGWLYFTNEEDSKEDGATRKPGCMAGDGGRDGVQQPKREICKKIVVLGALSPPPKKKEKKKEK